MLIRFSYALMRNKPHPLSVDNKPQNRRYLMYRFHEDIIT